MKKIISLALCCVIAASTFASCAQTPAKNYSPKITVSSSEADTYASWLTNRLGDSLENSVYLALGHDPHRRSFRGDRGQDRDGA